jgi:acyl-CoA synthetase (NDP forming)
VNDYRQTALTAARTRAISNFFAPRTVAVLGASSSPEKVGNKMVKLLLSSRELSAIYPVNLNGGKIHGLTAVPSVDDIPETIDLAIIALAANYVPEAVEACIRLEVGGIIVLSSGFGEAGPAGGLLQQKIVRSVENSGIPLLGPNCAGVIDFHNGFSANFGPMFKSVAEPGHVSIVSQSGGFATALYERLLRYGIGLAKVATTGNECGITATELIMYLADDPDTDIIVAYLEQIRDVPRFMRELPRMALRKPVIIEKVGRSPSGARAASSHTASLVGSADVISSAMRQAGVLRAASLDEVVNFVSGLRGSAESRQIRPMPDRNIAILSQGGGFLVELADLCEEAGLAVPVFSAQTQACLQSLLPDFAATANPVDFTAELLNHPEWIPAAVRLVEQDPAVSGTILALSSISLTDGVDSVAKAARAAAKPLIIACVAESARDAAARLHAAGVSTVDSTAAAVAAMRGVAAYRTIRERMSARVQAAAEPPRRSIADLTGTPRASIAAAREAGRRILMEFEAKKVIGSYGIPVTRETLVTSKSELKDAAEGIGFPVVLKVMAPELAHKTEVDAVRVGCTDIVAADQAYGEILENVRASGFNGEITGVLVCEQCDPLVEAIVGMTYDAHFGPVVSCGLGGVFTEMLQDVSLRVAPVRLRDALEMIDETRLSVALGGFRGRAPGDRQALAETIVGLSALVTDMGMEIDGVDLNPVAVFKSGGGAKVLDASIWLSDGPR